MCVFFSFLRLCEYEHLMIEIPGEERDGIGEDRGLKIKNFVR